VKRRLAVALQTGKRGKGKKKRWIASPVREVRANERKRRRQFGRRGKKRAAVPRGRTEQGGGGKGKKEEKNPFTNADLPEKDSFPSSEEEKVKRKEK